MLNKTRKFCPRCSKVKPVSEFYQNVTTYDGLVGYCKECVQEYRLGVRGKWYNNLHKRPYPLNGRCEICIAPLTKYDYHHWDDNNPSLGIWVCASCDYLAEGLDEMDRSPWKVEVYRRLKEEIERTEEAYVYLGPYSPSNNVRRLFLSGKQTHKWCAHCGAMKPIDEFNRSRSSFDGLRTWCKRCRQGSSMYYRNKRFLRLHKRPKPACCEFCNGKTHLVYHHWDDSNKSKGIWVCQVNKCHDLAEAVDNLSSDSLLPGKYYQLKQEVVGREAEKVLLTKRLGAVSR